MRFSVECAFPHLGKRGATSRKSAFCYLRLTEKRTLQPTSHGKTHSGPDASRKSAFCPDRLTESRTLRSPDRADCAFPSRRGAREVWGNRPPGCGALWKVAQLGKRARATPRQPAGRLAPSSRNGDDHVCDRPRPSCASTRPLKSCGLVQTTAMRVQTPTREVPFSIAR